MDLLQQVHPALYASCLQLVQASDPELYNELTAVEEEIVRLFHRLDKNRNGSVSRGELRTFLYDFQNTTKDRRNVWAVAVLRNYDVNGNENLSVQEVRAMIVGTLGPDNLRATVRMLRTIVDAPCRNADMPHVGSRSEVTRSTGTALVHHTKTIDDALCGSETLACSSYCGTCGGCL